jgi:hypothetical protein
MINRHDLHIRANHQWGIENNMTADRVKLFIETLVPERWALFPRRITSIAQQNYRVRNQALCSIPLPLRDEPEKDYRSQ